MLDLRVIDRTGSTGRRRSFSRVRGTRSTTSDDGKAEQTARRPCLPRSDTRLAVNEIESWSGFLGLKAHVERSFPGTWFREQAVTGSHRASVHAVAHQTCDVAAIDITVWEHIVATEPEAATNLRIIDRTVDWPAPPFSLGSHLDLERRNSLRAALIVIGPSDMPSLDGIVPADSDLYQDVMPVRSPNVPSPLIVQARDADRK